MLGKQRLCQLVLSVLGILLIIGGCLIIAFFDKAVNAVIAGQLMIRNGSEAFDRWREPPVTPYLKLYFHNVTNSKEYLDNHVKPNLRQVGPYVYREKWIRTNISLSENKTATFHLVKYYFFDEEMSNGTESDMIHTLDVPVITAVNKVKYMNSFVKLTVSSMLQVLNKTAFVSRNVSDLIWGYDDPLLELGNRFFPPDQQVPFKKFGFFYQKNGTGDGPFNVNTGETGMDTFSKINTYQYKTHVDFWKTEQCNRINGTDGTGYPPGAETDTTLYIFNQQLCRSMPLVFEQYVEHSNIPASRFSPPRDVFADISENPYNECFCLDGPPCVGGGLFNISACQFDAPVILSFPHFYNAKEYYVNQLSGLKPQRDLHEFYVDIVSSVGIPLKAQIRLQINVVTTNVKEIKPVQNLTNLVFPILWFEDGVTDMPEDVLSLLDLAVRVPGIAKQALMLSAFIIGGLFFVIALILVLRQQSKSKVDLPRSNGHANPMVSNQYPDK